MTREEYGCAYEKGFERTVRFLISRGISAECARDTAQSAWVRGWEKVGQLRESWLLPTWMNTIALNLYRTSLRRPNALQGSVEQQVPAKVNLAAIDVQTILKNCRKNDSLVLQRHYIEGYSVKEIASFHGWSETAVRIRLLRARRAVAKTLAA